MKIRCYLNSRHLASICHPPSTLYRPLESRQPALLADPLHSLDPALASPLRSKQSLLERSELTGSIKRNPQAESWHYWVVFYRS